MNDKVRQEVIKVLNNLGIECPIESIPNNVNWYNVSSSQKLSEDFIREFKSCLDSNNISMYQKLSEDFIREFKDYLSWAPISAYQKLSEDFIKEFKDYVDWFNISISQKLSESFIREFKDYVIWNEILESQTLSEAFIGEFQDEINIKVYLKTHKEKTLEQKRQEVKEYAERHNLGYDDEFLYAFRNHDENGCGYFNKTICYEKEQYYRDWHCNTDPYAENSFGLGIFPAGNTPVRVKIEDWGVEVDGDDGKGRVWGFEIYER